MTPLNLPQCPYRGKVGKMGLERGSSLTYQKQPQNELRVSPRS